MSRLSRVLGNFVAEEDEPVVSPAMHGIDDDMAVGLSRKCV